MADKFTVRDFFERFPSEEACLEHIMEVRYGLRHDCRKCGVNSTFHRMSERRAYACSHCGDHVYPTAGTVFHDTRTSLQMWFYVIFLFVVTRHGVSGKELQRQLGVTYKTAWRMGHQIRDLMAKADGFELLKGHIEADEAYIGGRRSGGKRGRGAPGKTVVMGIKERGGRIMVEPIPNIKKNTLREVVLRNVEPGATVSTDELMSYGLLEGDGYQHGTVKHGAREYVRYDQTTGVLHHVNNVESFWRVFKKSVASTHIHVSRKHLSRYLGEFACRSNHRQMENAMFDLLIGAV